MAGLLDDCYDRSWTEHRACAKLIPQNTLLIKFQTHRGMNEDHVDQFVVGPGKRASYLDHLRAEEGLVANGIVIG